MAINAGTPAIVGIATCWLGLFLPGLLMIYAVLPWWGAFRGLTVYRRSAPRRFLNIAAPFGSEHAEVASTGFGIWAQPCQTGRGSSHEVGGCQAARGVASQTSAGIVPGIWRQCCFRMLHWQLAVQS